MGLSRDENEFLRALGKICEKSGIPISWGSVASVTTGIVMDRVDLDTELHPPHLMVDLRFFLTNLGDLDTTAVDVTIVKGEIDGPSRPDRS